jgi:hypothetical protein
MNQVFGKFYLNVIILIALVFYWGSVVCAAEMVTDEKPKFSPIDALHATWVFSGIVSSESGEDYGYYFQLQRDDDHFHTSVALMDQASKKVLFHEEMDETIDHARSLDWHVGRAFLKFNPVNDNWIFGVKPKNNLGFNFKADMLKQFEHAPSLHHLDSGVQMMVMQTSELNGHVMTGNENNAQFVNTKASWFRQIWQDKVDSKGHDLSTVLCHFNDGSKFYSVHLQEQYAQSGAIAGWFNPQGTRQTMSQFIQVSRTKTGDWRIHAQTPHLDLRLHDAIEQPSVVAGFVQDAKNPGFCMLNQGQKLIV